jgi:hypothetical protein
MRSIVVGVVGVMVAACGFPPEANSPKRIAQIAAPTTLRAKPLAVGQWVTYRERVGSDPVGSVHFEVIAEAACGTWIEALLVGRAPQRLWKFCIAPDHQIVKATLDGEPVSVAEYHDELEPLRTRVLPPLFDGQFVREDADVPAGHFAETLRLDQGTTTWLHPAVPLGAVVKVRAGAREDDLAAYGDRIPDHMWISPVQTSTVGGRARPAKIAELAIGNGWAPRTAPVVDGYTNVITAAIGFTLSPDVDVLGHFVVTMANSNSTMPAATLVTGALTVRVHLPYGVYLQPEVGLASLQSGGGDSHNGPAIGGGVGWDAVRTRDGALGVEVDYDYARILDANRQMLGVTVHLRLELR